MDTLPVSDGKLTPDALAASQSEIPPVAHVLANLLRLLGDPDSALEDIAELIRLDPALATRVIQVSNSAWFGRTASCETIVEAVNRIGFREAYHVVAVVGSTALVSQPARSYQRDAMAMWHEAVACAFAAELLAERTGEDSVVCYMSGLVHGIGRLPIDRHIAAQAGGVKVLVDGGFPLDQSSAEFALLGFTQADVTAAMLTRWQFPEAVIEAVRRQFEPLEAQEPHDRTAAVLYAARLLRTVICQKKEPPAADNDEAIFGLLHYSRDDVLSFLPKLQEQMARAKRMTNA
jgi:HD-like signal output (HDOD) protein